MKDLKNIERFLKNERTRCIVKSTEGGCIAYFSLPRSFQGYISYMIIKLKLGSVLNSRNIDI
jgi:hypothetical protein